MPRMIFAAQTVRMEGGKANTADLGELQALAAEGFTIACGFTVASGAQQLWLQRPDESNRFHDMDFG